MTRSRSANIVIIVLIVAALAGLAYFGGLTHKYSGKAPESGLSQSTATRAPGQQPVQP